MSKRINKMTGSPNTRPAGREFLVIPKNRNSATAAKNTKKESAEHLYPSKNNQYEQLLLFFLLYILCSQIIKAAEDTNPVQTETILPKRSLSTKQIYLLPIGVDTFKSGTAAAHHHKNIKLS
jgi:hypothetical protein